MELIHDWEYCKKLVDSRKRCISNCFFMPAQIKELVKRQKLYYQSLGENFLILHRELSFYRVYYFIKAPDQLHKITLDMQAVIEFPFRETMTEEQKDQVMLIEKMGFHLERESARMSIKMEDFDYSRAGIEFPDLKIDFAQADDAPAVCRLFRETFDELFAFLLTEDELKEHIKNRSVLVASHKNKIVGAFNFEISGKIVNGGQLAVTGIGSGAGWLLLNKFHVLYRDKVKTLRFWVDLSNKPAINMYKRAGYKYDGCKANEYIYVP